MGTPSISGACYNVREKLIGNKFQLAFSQNPVSCPQRPLPSCDNPNSIYESMRVTGNYTNEVCKVPQATSSDPAAQQMKKVYQKAISDDVKRGILNWTTDEKGEKSLVINLKKYIENYGDKEPGKKGQLPVNVTFKQVMERYGIENSKGGIRKANNIPEEEFTGFLERYPINQIKGHYSKIKVPVKFLP